MNGCSTERSNGFSENSSDWAEASNDSNINPTDLTVSINETIDGIESDLLAEYYQTNAVGNVYNMCTTVLSPIAERSREDGENNLFEENSNDCLQFELFFILYRR